MTKNYYQLLGIERTASAAEIKEAYRKLSKKIHPDLNQGEAFFDNYFKEVKEAYETLSDRYKKRMYDIEAFISAGVTEEKVSGYSKLINYPKTKVLELKLAGLETDLREQTALLVQVEAAKETLEQELKKYTAELITAENNKKTLLSEIAQLQAYKTKQETEEKAIALHVHNLDNQLRQQQQVISGLETKQQDITNELQQYRNEENESARLVSDLEARLQEQDHAILTVQSEKKTLDQQIETYREELARANVAKNNLQSKIQELERKSLANTVKETKPQPQISALNPGEKNLKTIIQALETEKKALKQELENYLTKLAEAEKVRNAHQHKIEELTLYKASQDVKEKQILGKVTALEQKLREQQTLLDGSETKKKALEQELEKYIKELLAANNHKTDLQTRLQELKKEKADIEREAQELALRLAALETKLQEQQTLLVAAQTEKDAFTYELKQTKAQFTLRENELVTKISGLENKLHHQEDLLTTVEAEMASTQTEKGKLVLEVESYLQELQTANNHKTGLQAKLQELENEKADRQKEAKELALQVAALETKLQEQQTLQVAAQTEKNAIKEALEQAQAAYRAKENDLIRSIAELEEKISAQGTLISTAQAEKETLRVSLQDRTAELEIANNLQNSLQHQIKELEQNLASQKIKEQALTGSLTELETTLQHQQRLYLATAPEKESLALNRESQMEEMEAAKPLTPDKLESQPVNSKLKEKKETQPSTENILQNEINVLKSKLIKVATEQPFIVEEIDFYTEKDKQETGHSFASHKTKYLFPRLRVIMLAEQPGQIKILVKYIKPNGELDFDMRISPRGFSFSETINYQPEDEYIYLAGWGTDKENNFAVGEHTLEVYNESGRQIGKAKFNIVKKLLRFTEMFQK